MRDRQHPEHPGRCFVRVLLVQDHGAPTPRYANGTRLETCGSIGLRNRRGSWRLQHSRGRPGISFEGATLARPAQLLKAFKGGRFTDETFALMEIEIKRIQADLLEIEIVKEITAVAEAPQPIIEEIKNNDAEILKAIKEFNKILKK